MRRAKNKNTKFLNQITKARKKFINPKSS